MEISGSATKSAVRLQRRGSCPWQRGLSLLAPGRSLWLEPNAGLLPTISRYAPGSVPAASRGAEESCPIWARAAARNR
jgi:hypothetical protein